MTAIVVASIILIVVGWITYMSLRRRPPKKGTDQSKARERINLEKIRLGFRGRPFYQLVEYHLQQQRNADEFKYAIIGTIKILPLSAHPLVEPFIDRWNNAASDKEFWRTDTSEVFSRIVDDARSVLQRADAVTDDETLFNMFQLVTLTYAHSASNEANMRQFIGMRE